MNNLFETIKQVTLSTAEKSRMRRNLGAFMETLPAPQRSFTLGRFFWSRRFYTSLTLAGVLVFAFGGTAFAANNSLPGDMLYPVKTQVEEPVMTALTFSDSGKAALKTRLAEKRLEEIEKLVANGQADAQVLSQTKANFSTQENTATALIQKVEDQGHHDQAAALGLQLETSLRAHETILKNLQAKASTSPAATSTDQSLVNDLSQEANRVQQDRQDNEKQLMQENQNTLQSAAKQSRSAVLDKISEVQDFTQSKLADLSGNAASAINSQITVAQGLMVQGDQALAQGNFGQAFNFYQQARSAIQKAKLAVSAHADIQPSTSTVQQILNLQISTGDQETEHGDSGQGHSSGENNKSSARGRRD